MAWAWIPCWGGRGDDQLQGGEGDDYLDGGEGDDFLLGDAGNDNLLGGNGNDQLQGGEGDDYLVGGGGDDILFGEMGGDSLLGGAGVDYLNGGAGDDTYIFFRGDAQGRTELVGDTIIRFSDTIEDSSGNNTLVLSGWSSLDGIESTIQGSNLHLDLGGGDKIIILNGLNGTINNIQFSSSTYAIPTLQTNLNDIFLSTLTSSVTLTAQSADTTLAGGKNNDTLTGHANGSTLVGGRGNDTLRGRGGETVYVFGRGDGNDTISTTKATDIIRFGEGINSTHVNISRNMSNLFLTLDTGEIITVTNMFSNTSNSAVIANQAIETLTFVNGEELDLNWMKQQLLTGGGGNDTLIGFETDDVIAGGEGNDLLQGMYGNDIYEYHLGDGNDTIWDTSGIDILRFGEGVSQDNIRVHRATSNASNLLITLINGQQITLQNFSSTTGGLNAQNAIEFIEFVDGTVWNYEHIVQQAVKGTEGNDAVYGFSTDDMLIGSKGNDTLYGGAGNDAYVYSLGDGNDIIHDTGGIDTLRFGEGIFQDNIRVYRSAGNASALLIALANGQQITLQNFSSTAGVFNTQGAIEFIEFVDGAVWDFERIVQQAVNGTVGDDTIYGFSAQDTLYGGKGNDALYGGVGNDVYIYNLGDGNDTLIDTGGIDTLRFGEGISHDGIRVYRPDSGSSNLLITLEDGLQITLQNFSSAAGVFNTQRGIEFIEFADGTVWDFERIAQEVVKGTDGHDTIYGLSTDDTFIGGKGNDRLYGGTGNNVYIINSGDGYDIIHDAGGNDSISFGEGIHPDDVMVAKQNNKLFFFLTTGQFVEIDLTYGHPQANNPYVIEQVMFANGDVWTATTIEQRIVETAQMPGVLLGIDDEYRVEVSQPGNFYINGLDSGSLVGGEGDDTFIAGIGNRSFSGGGGSDTFFINQGGKAIFDFNVADDQLVFIDDVTLADLKISFPHGYVLNISTENLLVDIDLYNVSGDYPDLYFNVLETDMDRAILRFSDGSEASFADLMSIYFSASESDDSIRGLLGQHNLLDGGDGNDTLLGSHFGDDTLLGGPGNDTLIGGDKSSYVVDEPANFSGNDVLVGGVGDDWLEGTSSAYLARPGTEADTYIYNLGDGNDTIQDRFGDDRIMFGAGIAPGDVRVRIDVYGTMMLQLSAGGSITVLYMFSGDSTDYSQAIEKIIFADGTTWDIPQLIQLALQPTEGNDTIGGLQTGGVLEGGLGNDVLIGASGNDTYRFNRGDGQDTISDTGGIDVIAYTGDITEAQVNLHRQGNHLVARLGSDDIITVSNMFDGASGLMTDHAIEAFRFVSGVEWNHGRILQEVLRPYNVVVALDGTSASGETFANTTVAAFHIDEQGNMQWLGESVSDSNGHFVITFTTSFTQGEGIGLIATNMQGVVSATVEITAPDYRIPVEFTLLMNDQGNFFSGTAGVGHTVSVLNAAGQVLGVTHSDVDGNYHIALSAVYTNGETFTVVATDTAGIQSGYALVSASDTVAPDTPAAFINSDGSSITGTAEANSMVVVCDIGGALLGSVQAAADGSYQLLFDIAMTNGETLHVTASDASGKWSPARVLVAPDITAPALPSGVMNEQGFRITGTAEAGSTVVIRNASGQMLGYAIAHAVSGEYSLTLNNGYKNGEVFQVVSVDRYGNTSVATQVIAPDTTAPIVPLAIISSDGARIIDTGGNDRIVFAEGIMPEHVNVRRSGSGLDLTQNTGERITIQNIFNATTGAVIASYAIEGIYFADGTVWAPQQLWQKMLEGTGNADIIYGLDQDDLIEGGAGNDSLYGFAGNDVLIGGVGNDSLEGGAGDDMYLFSRSEGQDTVRDAAGNDSLIFGEDIAADQLWFSRTGNHLQVSVIGTFDNVLINNWYQGVANQVETFVLADNSILASPQIDNLVQAMAAFAPPAVGETSLSSAYRDSLEPVIAANWQ